MIHTTPAGIPKRRLAVISVPRPQRTRLGSIGGPEAGAPSRGAAVAWTTISDAAPDQSDNWLSYKLLEQQRARETTPGTLSYTLANLTPDPNTPPWNSWLSPNCSVQSDTGAPVPPPATKPDYSKLWLVIGALTAAASIKYLVEKERK